MRRGIKQQSGMNENSKVGQLKPQDRPSNCVEERC